MALNEERNLGISDSGSVSGLKIALSTMKERCQNLQNRLSSLEEENLQLRIERHTLPGIYKKDPDMNKDLNSLNRKVEELSRVKSKLSHHIFMVATENKELWEKLSKLTDDKNSLEYTSDILKPKKSIKIIGLCKEKLEESLEEIPLNTASKSNSKDKQAEDKAKGFEFPLSDVSCEDQDSEPEDDIHIELDKVLEKLKTEKSQLQKQIFAFKAAFKAISECNCVNVKEAEKESTSSSISDEKNKGAEEVVTLSNGIIMNNMEDRICPLCTKFFPKLTPFDEFNDHVLSHFVEESENDSHLNVYEVTA